MSGKEYKKSVLKVINEDSLDDLLISSENIVINDYDDDLNQIKEDMAEDVYDRYLTSFKMFMGVRPPSESEEKIIKK